MATAYLVLYNVAQTLGWSYIMVTGVLTYSQSPTKLYSAVSLPLQVFQTLAALEVLHAILGLVRSNVFVTAFQVASRVFVVWPILAAFEETQSSVGFPMLLAAWTVTEIIRYGFVKGWSVLVVKMRLIKALFAIFQLFHQILRRESDWDSSLFASLPSLHFVHRTLPAGRIWRVVMHQNGGFQGGRNGTMVLHYAEQV